MHVEERPFYDSASDTSSEILSTATPNNNATITTTINYTLTSHASTTTDVEDTLAPSPTISLPASSSATGGKPTAPSANGVAIAPQRYTANGGGDTTAPAFGHAVGGTVYDRNVPPNESVLPPTTPKAMFVQPTPPAFGTSVEPTIDTPSELTGLIEVTGQVNNLNIEKYAPRGTATHV